MIYFCVKTESDFTRQKEKKYKKNISIIYQNFKHYKLGEQKIMKNIDFWKHENV